MAPVQTEQTAAHAAISQQAIGNCHVYADAMAMPGISGLEDSRGCMRAYSTSSHKTPITGKSTHMQCHTIVMALPQSALPD
jgi:hypothetical protein